MNLPGFTNTFGVLSQMAALHAIRREDDRQARLEREAEIAEQYAAAADDLVGEARELRDLARMVASRPRRQRVAWDEW